MKKTVAPSLALVYDRFGDFHLPPKQAVFAGRGVRWLAEVLGISRQRASKLLNEGRVLGAVRDPKNGEWDLSGSSGQVRPGKRGPHFRAHFSSRI